MTNKGRRKVVKGKLNRRRTRRKKTIRVPHNYAQFNADKKQFGVDVANYNDGFVAGRENGGANTGRKILRALDRIALAYTRAKKRGVPWPMNLRRMYEDAVALVEKRVKADKKIKAKHDQYCRKVKRDSGRRREVDAE